MDYIEKAFKSVNRADFMPDNVKNRAGIDSAMPIGYGQTISQPTTVQMMLEWLEVQPGDIVLDIGSGSGWTTALLSHLVGSKGRVFAVERIPELVEFGRENCRRAGIKNAKFFRAKSGLGLAEHGPYDRILISAAATKFPRELLTQLKDGGKMVIPVNNDIIEIEKNGREIITTTHPGFIFVPLISGAEAVQ